MATAASSPGSPDQSRQARWLQKLRTGPRRKSSMVNLGQSAPPSCNGSPSLGANSSISALLVNESGTASLPHERVVSSWSLSEDPFRSDGQSARSSAPAHTQPASMPSPPLRGSAPPRRVLYMAPSASTSGDQVFSGIPLLPYQKYIIAHAILSMLGFLVFLPLGAIVARWLRTFTSIWFTAHWVIQFGVGEFHSYLTLALCSPPNYLILRLGCQPVAYGVWPHPSAFPTIPYHFNPSLRRDFYVQLYHHLHC